LDSDEFPTAKPRFGNDSEEFFVMDEQMNNSMMHFIDEEEDKYSSQVKHTAFASKNDIWASPSRPPGLKQEAPRAPDPNNPLTKLLGSLPPQSQPPQNQPQQYMPPGMQ